MPLLDVRQVFIVQDRDSGAFVDETMGFCTSFKNAVRIDSKQIAHEHMNNAIYDGQIECPDGYEVHAIYEERV